jgi:hypothetical protein
MYSPIKNPLYTTIAFRLSSKYLLIKSGAILGGSGNFSLWGLVGGSRSQRPDFEGSTWSLVPFLLLSASCPP